MKKTYAILAAAVVTAFAVSASADRYGYQERRQPRYQQDDQPLPLPTDGPNQGPDQGQPDPRSGINVYGNGNTIIIQTTPDGRMMRAIAPVGCMYDQSCQQNLQYQQIGQMPVNNCGYYPCQQPIVPYYNYNAIPYTLHNNYNVGGYGYRVYAPPAYRAPGFGFAQTPGYGLRYPARRW